MKLLLVTFCCFFSITLKADGKPKKTLAEAKDWWNKASEAAKKQQRQLRCGGDAVKKGAECQAVNAELVAMNMITPQEAAALNSEGLYADFLLVSSAYTICPCE